MFATSSTSSMYSEERRGRTVKFEFDPHGPESGLSQVFRASRAIVRDL